MLTNKTKLLPRTVFENFFPFVLLCLKNLVRKVTHSCDVKTFLIMSLLLLYGLYDTIFCPSVYLSYKPSFSSLLSTSPEIVWNTMLKLSQGLSSMEFSKFLFLLWGKIVVVVHKLVIL